MNPSGPLENRTETEAIALLKSEICPICLHPLELVGYAGGFTGHETDYECEACGHEFTVNEDYESGVETLEYAVGDWSDD